MKNFRINRQPIHQILVNPLIEIEKVMGGLFLESAIHKKSATGVILSGLPILSNLLRYEAVVVVDYGCMSHMPPIEKIRDLRSASP